MRRKIFRFCFFVFLAFVSSSANAEMLKKLEIIGNSRISNETIKVYGEIELNKDYYNFLNEPNKYAEVYFTKDFSTYDSVSVTIKNNSPNKYVTNSNEKYSIISIRGLIKYNEDFDSCIQKRDGIVEILSEMFSNAEITESIFTYGEGSFDESEIDSIVFHLSSGEVEAQCNDWNETYRIQNNFTEGLSVIIYSEEIVNWFSN